MTEYYEIVDFEKLTYGDFFKRYFPELCKEDSFDEIGFINGSDGETEYHDIICKIRQYILLEKGWKWTVRSKKKMDEIREKLLTKKGWETFPFKFATPFDAVDETYVIIGTLNAKKMIKNDKNLGRYNIIVGNRLFQRVDL